MPLVCIPCWCEKSEEQVFVFRVHGKWLRGGDKTAPVHIAVITLEFRIVPAFTCFCVVVRFVPGTESVSLQTIFPNPIRTISKVFDAYDLFFRKGKIQAIEPGEIGFG